MIAPRVVVVVGWLLAFALGLCWPSAHAAEPAIDRTLVERLARAAEAQARATESLASVIDRRLSH